MTLPPSRYALVLSRHRTAATGVSLAVINAFVLAATWIYATQGRQWGWRVRYIAARLDLRVENNVAVWYSSMLFFLVALAALGAYTADRHTSERPRDRLLDFGWLVMAALFAALSLDELGSLHERISNIPGLNLSASTLNAWVGAVAIPGALIVLFLLAFAGLRVRRSVPAFLLLILAVMLLATIPFQEEWESRMRAEGGAAVWRRPGVLVALEEGAELFGALGALLGTLIYTRAAAAPRHGKAGSAALRQMRLTPTPRQALRAVVLLTAGMAPIMVLSAQPWFDVNDGRGIPLHWFPAALALLVALLAAYGADAVQQAEAGARRAWPFMALALVSLFLSADHGAAHLITREFWAGTPERRVWLDLGLSVLVAGTACALVRQRQFGAWGRSAIVAWAALIVTGIFLGGMAAVLGGFTASAVLLIALSAALAADPVAIPVFDVAPGPHQK